MNYTIVCHGFSFFVKIWYRIMGCITLVLRDSESKTTYMDGWMDGCHLCQSTLTVFPILHGTTLAYLHTLKSLKGCGCGFDDQILVSKSIIE